MSPDSDNEGGFPVPGACYVSSCDTVSGGGSDWSSLYRWSNRVTRLWVACTSHGLELQQLDTRAHIHSPRAGAGWAEMHGWVRAGASSADPVSGASLPPLPGRVCGSLPSPAPSTAHSCRVPSQIPLPSERAHPACPAQLSPPCPQVQSHLPTCAPPCGPDDPSEPRWALPAVPSFPAPEGGRPFSRPG